MTSEIISEEKIFAKGLTQKEYNKQYKKDNKEKLDARSRSRVGLIERMHSSQRRCSKKRNHPAPDYSLKQLRAWVFSQPNFEELYQNWAAANFDTKLVPSCDRIDDYKPYTLVNLQLTTWKKNKARGYNDIRNGINNKRSKAVLQLTLEGIVISEYHSGRHASRVTGVAKSSLSKCCLGGMKAAGGFVWCFA